jgi:hypothetical protein
MDTEELEAIASAFVLLAGAPGVQKSKLAYEYICSCGKTSFNEKALCNSNGGAKAHLIEA